MEDKGEIIMYNNKLVQYFIITVALSGLSACSNSTTVKKVKDEPVKYRVQLDNKRLKNVAQSKSKKGLVDTQLVIKTKNIKPVTKILKKKVTHKTVNTNPIRINGYAQRIKRTNRNYQTSSYRRPVTNIRKIRVTGDYAANTQVESFITMMVTKHGFDRGYLNYLLAKRLHLKRQVWFEKGGNAHGFKRNILKRFVPWPVEGESVYARAGIPLFESEGVKFDKQVVTRFRKRMLALAKQQHADGMLSKRVANNRRIPWLKAAFPEAKFIHLIRDGRDVAYSFSQVSWWHENTQVWWAGKTMRELVEQEGWDNLSVTARTWVEAVQAVEEGLKEVPESQILDNPLRTLSEIIDFMQVETSQAYMQEVKGLNLRPVDPKWDKKWDDHQYAQVLTQQQELLLNLGYQ